MCFAHTSRKGNRTERHPAKLVSTRGVASEVQLCNILIDGAAQLIKWENAIETGEGKAEAEAAIAAMSGGAPAAGSYPELHKGKSCYSMLLSGTEYACIHNLRPLFNQSILREGYSEIF